MSASFKMLVLGIYTKLYIHKFKFKFKFKFKWVFY